MVSIKKMNYSYIIYIPLFYISVIFYKMGKDYIEVSYHEKWKKKLN